MAVSTGAQQSVSSCGRLIPFYEGVQSESGWMVRVILCRVLLVLWLCVRSAATLPTYESAAKWLMTRSLDARPSRGEEILVRASQK